MPRPAAPPWASPSRSPARCRRLRRRSPTASPTPTGGSPRPELLLGRASTPSTFRTGAYFADRGVDTFYPLRHRDVHRRGRGRRHEQALPRAAAAQPVRLFDLQRELDHERRVRQPRREQVRQGREPRRADLPRHPAPRDRRPQRHLAAARRGAGRLVPDRRQRAGGRDRHAEEHRVRVREEARHPLAGGVPAEARGALRDRVRLDRGRPLAGRAVRVGAHPRRRAAARPLVRAQGSGHAPGDRPGGGRRDARHRRRQGPRRC